MASKLDQVRASTLATLGEIVDAENAFKRSGLDVSDEREWRKLGSYVARIERRLAQKLAEPKKVST